MEESTEKNWREWSKDTTDRQGRERDLEEYEGYLGFSREGLRGKKVLDIGSGETELFSRQVRQEIPDVEVYSINPDYSEERYRETVNRKKDWQKKSLAALGQELPFKNESFDQVFALYSLTTFAEPWSDRLIEEVSSERAQRWISDIMRVLKFGGEARLAPIFAHSEEMIREGEYKELIALLAKENFSVILERIRNSEKARYPIDAWRMIIHKPTK